MTVRVDEVHTDVVPVAAAETRPGAAASARSGPPWEAEDRWREARGRVTELELRTAAEDFDD